MKRHGLLLGVLLSMGLLPGNSLFASSMCTGTLADLLEQGACNFDVFTIQFLSFSTTGSTPGNPVVLDASQIQITATALLGDTTVNVVVSPTDGQFHAGTAPAGTTVSADYHIAYALIGPSVFESEFLRVNGGSVSLPAGYNVTKTANGSVDRVDSIGRQGNTTLLPGTDTSLQVTDDIVLNASTTAGRRGRPPVVGSSQISSVQNTFLALPPPPIPEPVACVLCGSGLLLFGYLSRRRRQ